MTNRHRCVLAMMVLAAGCVGTAPPRLYTLNMQRSGGAAPDANIEVTRLRPLDALSSGDIVIRRNEHELDSYPLDHWASNIGELTAEKLSIEFGDAAPGRATVGLSGQILAFEQVNNDDGTTVGRASFELEIRKKGASRYAGPLLAKTYRAESPVIDGVTPGHVVAALSLAVEAIARDVAADVNALDLSEGPVTQERELLHTLDMKPSGKAVAPLNIEVSALRRSEALARSTILIRPGPTSVEYYPADRWAASVPTLVAEKLKAEFGAPVTGRDSAQLSGTILAFERLDSDGGTAGHVKLDLTLEGGRERGAGRPTLWKVYEVSVPAAGNSANDVAVALSRALEQIAVEIAADAGRIPPARVAPAAPPMRLYTLDMTPSGKVHCKYNVSFDRIQLHDSLTRSDILIVRNETVVDRYEHDRWASSLAELVPEKLAAEFGHPEDGRKTVNVSGTISGFEQVENKGKPAAVLVKLNLAFRWQDAVSDAPQFRREYEATMPVDGEGALAAVKSLSRAVEKIAVEAAKDIDALKEPGASPQP